MSDAGGADTPIARRPTNQQPAYRAIGLVVLIYLLFVAIKLALYGGDPSRFIVAGDYFVDRSRLIAPIHVEPHSYGYDGQFYYRLAIDPLTAKAADFGITIDSPVVRSQRIVYPTIAWVLSLGHPAALPWLLIAINLIGVAAIARLGTILARHRGRPPSLGVLLACYPGFFLTISRDTSEIVAAGFALAALAFADRRQWAAAGIAGAVAVLTKEATLFYLAGFGVAGLWRAVTTRSGWRQVAWSALPVIAFGCWQIVLTHRWGSLPSGELGSHDLGRVPLLAYGHYVVDYVGQALTGPIRYRILFELVAIIAAGLLIATVGRTLIRTGYRQPGYVVPWLLYLLLASLFTGDIWNDGYGFLRVLADLYLLSVIILLQAGGAVTLIRLRVSIGIVWVGAALYAL